MNAEEWTDVAKYSGEEARAMRERASAEAEVRGAGWVPGSIPDGLWWHPQHGGATLTDALHLVREERYGDFDRAE